ncbi:hypothetical protein V2J09_016343, partial [Rumex salicifolius]
FVSFVLLLSWCATAKSFSTQNGATLYPKSLPSERSHALRSSLNFASSDGGAPPSLSSGVTFDQLGAVNYNNPGHVRMNNSALDSSSRYNSNNKTALPPTPNPTQESSPEKRQRVPSAYNQFIKAKPNEKSALGHYPSSAIQVFYYS